MKIYLLHPNENTKHLHPILMSTACKHLCISNTDIIIPKKHNIYLLVWFSINKNVMQ